MFIVVKKQYNYSIQYCSYFTSNPCFITKTFILKVCTRRSCITTRKAWSSKWPSTNMQNRFDTKEACKLFATYSLQTLLSLCQISSFISFSTILYYLWGVRWWKGKYIRRDRRGDLTKKSLSWNRNIESLFKVKLSEIYHHIICPKNRLNLKTQKEAKTNQFKPFELKSTLEEQKLSPFIQLNSMKHICCVHMKT